jgi:putative hydrolases of HD superfamily
VRDVRATAAALVAAGQLALAFGRVLRITYHPDGATPESDTDHTVMLGVIACALATEHFPGLDVGLVAQYALVHDLVEAYAGDTPTLRLPSPEGKADKQRREHAAYQRIRAEFAHTLSWLPARIDEYETRSVPEARFVRAVDKLMPKITHVLNDAATICRQGMSRAELADRYDAQAAEMAAYAADFPELFELRAVLVDQVLARLA